MAGRKKRKAPRRGKEPTEGLALPVIENGVPGRVVAHHGVAVLVRFAEGPDRQIWLQPEQRAVVGDRVQVGGDRFSVDEAYGVLRRRDPRGRERTIATNLDRLGIVVAPTPREPPGYIDRGFVIARAAGIEPFLVLNKSDLDEDGVLGDKLEEIYSPSARVMRVSAENGDRIDEITSLLGGGLLGAFVGPSGVGKSSLLNALVPDLDLRVGELNRGSGKGRHTTTTATLHALDGGGLLVDTAGFKDFIAVDLDPLEAAAGFPGFENAVLEGCRFRDCVHTTEPDCAVLAAVESGEVDERRHAAFVQLIAELDAMSDGRS